MIAGVTTRDLRPEIPPYCSEQVAALIRECWAPLPEMRPDFRRSLARANPSPLRSHRDPLRRPRAPIT
jgi:hypothetical protein